MQFSFDRLKLLLLSFFCFVIIFNYYSLGVENQKLHQLQQLQQNQLIDH